MTPFFCAYSGIAASICPGDGVALAISLASFGDCDGCGGFGTKTHWKIERGVDPRENGGECKESELSHFAKLYTERIPEKTKGKATD